MEAGAELRGKRRTHIDHGDLLSGIARQGQRNTRSGRSRSDD